MSRIHSPSSVDIKCGRVDICPHLRVRYRPQMTVYICFEDHFIGETHSNTQILGCGQMSTRPHVHTYVHTYVHTCEQNNHMTSQWLTSMLIDKGVLSETGLTRNAAIRTCRTCQHHTLAGIAITGLDTWLDPQPLHPAGELHALLDCRRTFSLYAGKQLIPRDRHWISNYPAGHPQRPTFATHTCGQPIPSTWTIKEHP